MRCDCASPLLTLLNHYVSCRYKTGVIGSIANLGKTMYWDLAQYPLTLSLAIFLSDTSLSLSLSLSLSISLEIGEIRMIGYRPNAIENRQGEGNKNCMGYLLVSWKDLSLSLSLSLSEKMTKFPGQSRLPLMHMRIQSDPYLVTPDLVTPRFRLDPDLPAPDIPDTPIYRAKLFPPSNPVNRGPTSGRVVLNVSQEPTDTSKQPISSRYLGHVTGYQPITDQYFLIWSVPELLYHGPQLTLFCLFPARSVYTKL
eukprot:sb/3468627/